jgi:hypothetical protein
MLDLSARPRRAFVGLKEAAEYFSVSERTLFNWRRAGFPTVKVGGRCLVPLEDAERWVRRYLEGGEQ